MSKPVIYFAVEAYQKMRLWVEMAKGEVSWLGVISEVRDKDDDLEGFLIEDIHLLHQTCSSANTVLDEQSVAKFLTEMAMKGEDTSRIKAWIHSHGNLKVFWSSVDEQCISGLANSSYLVSVVVNKDGQMLGRVDMFKPFHVTINDMPVTIHFQPNAALDAQCRKEFREKVTEQVPLAMLKEDPQEPLPFPGRTDEDLILEKLEHDVSTGKISLDEYQRRVTELEEHYDPMYD